MNRLKFGAAVAKSGAMEADTISKNGRSSKSQTSRSQILSYFVIAAFAVVVSFTSCGGGSGSSGSGSGKRSGKIKITTEIQSSSFYLCGNGVATVDWGDGSEKVSQTLSENGIRFQYKYPNASIRTITINGDNITSLFRDSYDYIFATTTSLDVSLCTELTELIIQSSQLTILDVSKNTALTRLKFNYSPLTSLDVSKNTALIDLDCSGNQLTSSALNALFGTLHSNPGEKIITIWQNPGTNDCDRSIAEKKGWRFQ